MVEMMLTPQMQLDWTRLILKKQVKMLYDAFPSSLLANIATAGLMSVVQWGEIDHKQLLMWWAGLLVVLLLRVGVYLEYKLNCFKVKKIILLNAFRFSVFVTGFVWGGIGIWFFTPENIPHQFVVAFLLAGLTSAAITTLAIDKLSAMLFVAPCLLPITINLIFEGVQFGYAMAGMVAFYICYVYMSATRLEGDIHESIRMQSTLENQKQELNNQKTLDEIIAKVQGSFIDKLDTQIFLRHMLDDLLGLTKSSYGFLVYKKENKAVGFSGEYLVVAGEHANNYSLESLSEKFNWHADGEAIYNGNNECLLKLPVFLSSELVAVIGFGRGEEYTQEHIDFLKPILLMLRQIVDAIFLQQKHKNIMQDFIRLSQVASQITNGVVVTDIKGRITWVNEGFVRLTEYAESDVVGKKPGDFLQGEDTDENTILIMREALLLRKNFNVDVINYSKSGKSYWVNIICNSLLNDEGELAGFMAVETNIDEQKKAEQELKYAYKLMERSNAVALTGTWRVDLDRMTVEWSSVTKAIHEVSESYSASVESGIYFYKEGSHRDRITQVFGRAVSEGVSFDEEFIIITALGNEKWVRSIGIPEFHNEKCLAIYGTFQDISEGKRIERVKNEFISTVSHELRTPLTSISGALGVMQSGALGDFGKKAEQLIDIAHKNSLRLSHMINDLLDVEKLAAGKMDFDMKLLEVNKAILQSLVGIKSYADQYGVTLQSISMKESIFIFVDENRLQQILANFLSNAIKFSSAGGEVVVTIAAVDKGIRISVTDKGVGISDDFKERIFSKFSQEDSSDTRKKGGTGLGLAISRELAEKMNGRVDFYSEAGLGATFYCEFPTVTS